jgi:hypothetical protein
VRPTLGLIHRGAAGYRGLYHTTGGRIDARWNDHAHTSQAETTGDGGLTVGTFVYGSSLTVLLDDDSLAHLQAVIGAKLRLQQPFHLSWGDPAHAGGSRSTIWVTPSISLQFHYRSARARALDRDRIDTLFAQANSLGGLVLHLDA